MAAFKDKKNGSWYVQFRYTDWRGERQQKLKRGFATKKEAQAWEREFLMQKQADVNMSFESFVALYEKDVKPKLKLNTWLSKEHIIRTKILPYFKKRKLSEITARDVIDWQNEIRQHTKSSGESYSPDYLKNVHTQLSCIFNHAIKYYGLQINPAAKAGNMGSEQPKEMLFWTKEEYLKFIDAMMDKPMLYYAFEILYWCGIREGELLALTPADFDFEKKTLRINKSYQRLTGQGRYHHAENEEKQPRDPDARLPLRRDTGLLQAALRTGTGQPHFSSVQICLKARDGVWLQGGRRQNHQNPRFETQPRFFTYQHGLFRRCHRQSCWTRKRGNHLSVRAPVSYCAEGNGR